MISLGILWRDWLVGWGGDTVGSCLCLPVREVRALLRELGVGMGAVIDSDPTVGKPC